MRGEMGGKLTGAKVVMQGLTESHRKSIIEQTVAARGDLIVLIAGDEGVVNRTLDGRSRPALPGP